MADQDIYKQDTTKTNVREIRMVESSGNSMALIVGGLVVAVAFVLWLVFGGTGPVATTSPTSDTTNVTIDAPAAPADTTTNVTIEPAPEAADPVAPADGSAPAPAATPAPADQ